MPAATTDLIDELAHDGGVTWLIETRVYGGAVPPDTALPFIWLQRRGIRYATEVEAEEEPLWEDFDIECVSDDASQAVEVSDAVRSCLHGAHGTVGDHVYSWVAVANAAETYVPRNVEAGENLFISSLDVEVTRP